VAGSYSSHAIIEPGEIIVTYPGGLVESLDQNYRYAEGLNLDADRIRGSNFGNATVLSMKGLIARLRVARTPAANLIPIVAFTCSLISPVWAGSFTVTAGHSEIVFDQNAGVPVRWAVCTPGCADKAAKRALLFAEDDGFFSVATPGGPGGTFSSSVRESADEVIVEFTAAHGRRIYRVSRTDARVAVELPPGASVELATGTVFIPEQLSGFGQLYSRVNAVQVDAAGQTIFDDPDQHLVELAPEGDSWVGLRNQYWAVLGQSLAGQISASIDTRQHDRPVMNLAGNPGDDAFEFVVYAGPVEWEILKKVSPVVSEMLFAALWDFLRALCFGMLILLGWLQSTVGSFGLAIILFSLANKILLTPLTMLADRWQADVNRINTLLQPELTEIKRLYKGEEAHMRTLAVYKKNDVSQLYTFKSAAGLMIQIPVFIAAFAMLAENIALSEITFLWINDLAKPDRFFELPFVLPFFGGWLNLLPFLMAGLSILAAVLQREDSLSEELQKQQSKRLYLMSAAFFLLFYTFPAGMVLYWTSSNLFHLLKVESGRLFNRLKGLQS
jgi:YidC/Oxa1 family membrane protein insertase